MGKITKLLITHCITLIDIHYYSRFFPSRKQTKICNFHTWVSYLFFKKMKKKNKYPNKTNKQQAHHEVGDGVPGSPSRLLDVHDDEHTEPERNVEENADKQDDQLVGHVVVERRGNTSTVDATSQIYPGDEINHSIGGVGRIEQTEYRV